MSQLIVYRETVDLVKTIDGIKTVDAWRDQFSNYRKEDGFLMPAVFIRMEASNFQNIGGNSGIQMYDLLVTLMAGFDHYTGTDYEKCLELKQRIFKKYHRFEPVGTTHIGRFLRNGEEMEIEYDGILIFGQSYLCQNCMDYDAQTQYKTATVDVPVTRDDIEITTEIDI
jgi:hypothetical protein